ncbi:MAG: hypothetical protein B6D74_04705 [gamma proteobacterium symbiont of Ctena orbiculata]|nr:MAG: hypothetical protein B6D74_04705 [gamma proteobacterium symbiont of Ctena orbiculata]
MVAEQFMLGLFAQPGGEDHTDSILAEQPADLACFIVVGSVFAKGKAPAPVVGVVSFDNPRIIHCANRVMTGPKSCIARLAGMLKQIAV